MLLLSIAYAIASLAFSTLFGIIVDLQNQKPIYVTD